MVPFGKVGHTGGGTEMLARGCTGQANGGGGNSGMNGMLAFGGVVTLAPKGMRFPNGSNFGL